MTFTTELMTNVVCKGLYKKGNTKVQGKFTSYQSSKTIMQRA